MTVHDKLMLLHRFLGEIIHTANEDELTSLVESYKEKLEIASDEDDMSFLLKDAQMLGREILFLRSDKSDIPQNRKLAALTADEKAELSEVERIIDKNRFYYHFQPIVNTTDGEIYSYEALMRPETESGKGIGPFHVLKYAELTGRLTEVERATFLNVLNIIDSNKEKFRDRRVFINSIPQIMLSGSDFRGVGELLIKHSGTVVVELTEQAEVDDDMLDVLKERYQNMGIKTAIDDYGTGYSNVSNLLRYMPDYVKIDRSLLSEIQDNSKKRHFVREIIDFCHENGIMALAEGVETAEELREVILLGADLIQGFYTAKPSSEIVDSIPYEIRQQIKLCQQERQDGADQHIYAAENGERVSLDKLVKSGCKCILAGTGDSAENSEITVIGTPALDTEIHIETARDFKGRITLENVHLSNVKNRPCIDLGDNSEVTLLLKGENKLDKSGIRVPEGAKLTVTGDGLLDIKADAADYFGIGNDISSRHGDLVFDLSSMINFTVSGRMGICIGSGLGGNITINQGKFNFKMSGNTAVGIGSLNAPSRLALKNCAFEADISLMRGVAIGSLTDSTEVSFRKCSTKVNMSGKELVAVGTISGDNTRVEINDAMLNIGIRAMQCTGVGSLEKHTEFKVDSAVFRADLGGENALPFGSMSGDTKVSLMHADVAIRMDTGADLKKYLSADRVEIVEGRTNITNHGFEIVL